MTPFSSFLTTQPDTSIVLFNTADFLNDPELAAQFPPNGDESDVTIQDPSTGAEVTLGTPILFEADGVIKDTNTTFSGRAFIGTADQAADLGIEVPTPTVIENPLEDMFRTAFDVSVLSFDLF